jgi:hypothetical protein
VVKKTICFLLISFHCFAQTPKISKYERCWALTHPWAAFKVKKISKRAYLVYNSPDVKFDLDNFSNGGKLDAFRHTFFMAAFAQIIKSKKIKKLGLAHERGNYDQFINSVNEDGELADSLSCLMDLHNNNVGLILGSANKKKTLEELKELVINEITNGACLIMKRDSIGNYLTCNNTLIDLKSRLKKWGIQKCLVSSNYH